MSLWLLNRVRLSFFALLISFLALLPATASSEAGRTTQNVVANLGAGAGTFTMPRADLQVDWAVDRNQEVACGGPAIAGGSTSGDAVFSHLGNSRIEASAAWDVGNLINNPQYEPDGPAGGPVAPILGPNDYPYQFHFDPRVGGCSDGLAATGEVRILAANGDEVHGGVQGGEAHRLDFLQPGDGVESFVNIEISGGTGRFGNAAGSFTMHTIVRFDPALGHFVIDLAEVLPGGTLTY
jgi:hypothetical protein